ncbi:hypothetical protein F4810DRAFT_697396 [Camillea tinctor]|nr:hypothetical protein F4810DRAFT_697396 [Camillea tinctor]
MSDNSTNGAPTGGGDAKKWTEVEKYQLLLKIMTQLLDSGGKIQPAKLSMPNRTAKSLSHLIAAFKKEAAQLGAGDGSNASASGNGPSSTTPPKKRTKAAGTPATGRKRAKKSDSDAELNEPDSDQDIPVTKRQRRAAPSKKKATLTPAKAEDSDNEPMFPNLDNGVSVGDVDQDRGI